MARRTRNELETENDLLLAELEAIRDRLDELLDDSHDAAEELSDADEAE